MPFRGSSHEEHGDEVHKLDIDFLQMIKNGQDAMTGAMRNMKDAYTKVNSRLASSGTDGSAVAAQQGKHSPQWGRSLLGKGSNGMQEGQVCVVLTCGKSEERDAGISLFLLRSV